MRIWWCVKRFAVLPYPAGFRGGKIKFVGKVDKVSEANTGKEVRKWQDRKE